MFDSTMSYLEARLKWCAERNQELLNRYKLDGAAWCQTVERNYGPDKVTWPAPPVPPFSYEVTGTEMNPIMIQESNQRLPVIEFVPDFGPGPAPAGTTDVGPQFSWTPNRFHRGPKDTNPVGVRVNHIGMNLEMIGIPSPFGKPWMYYEEKL